MQNCLWTGTSGAFFFPLFKRGIEGDFAPLGVCREFKSPFAPLKKRGESAPPLPVFALVARGSLISGYSADVLDEHKEMSAVGGRRHEPEMEVECVVFCVNGKGAYADHIGHLRARPGASRSSGG